MAFKLLIKIQQNLWHGQKTERADIIIIQCILLLTEVSLGAMQNKNTGVKQGSNAE